MKVLPLRPLSKEWFAYREKRISGSRVAYILGHGKDWSSALAEWARIVGNAPSEDVDNPYADWGNATEDLHRQWIGDQQSLDVAACEGIVPHPTLDFCCFSPDGFGFEAEGAHPILLEMKAPSAWTAEEWGVEVPMQYQVQVQFGMACCEVDQSVISVILPPKRDPLGAFVGFASDLMAARWDDSDLDEYGSLIISMRERGFVRQDYLLEANPEMQAAIFARLRMWWDEHVVGGEAPPATAADADKRILKVLGSDTPSIVFDEEVALAMERLDQANLAVKAAEKQKNLLQNTLTQRAGAKTWAEAKKVITHTRKELSV